MLDLIVFVLGLGVGSFLNVCIIRLPRGESALGPPSRCDACGTQLKIGDLVPVLGYLLLRGRCRYCGHGISSRYPAVELLTGLLFVWCLAAAGVGPALGKAWLLTAFLVVITFIDIDHQLILDKVLWWLAGTGLLINLLLGCSQWWAGYFGWPAALAASWATWLDMLVAALAGGGIMLLVAIVSRGGMGGGDIKFAAALGLWFGWKLTLLVLFLAFIAGGLGGIAVLALGLKGRKDFIPFGPFIALGALMGQLYGDPIITWYLGHYLTK
jgi:leader peptidase (prepilin peptidase) / N-methyltransferase